MEEAILLEQRLYSLVIAEQVIGLPVKAQPGQEPYGQKFKVREELNWLQNTAAIRQGTDQSYRELSRLSCWSEAVRSRKHLTASRSIPYPSPSAFTVPFCG